VVLLILNRFHLHELDAHYRRWLPDADLVLVTNAASAKNVSPGLLEGYREVVSVADYKSSPLVEHLAHELHRRYRFDGVVALSEYDLMLAARLRADWGLPGQQPGSALAFRDKLEMKRLLVAAGVPVTGFAPVRALTDLLRFRAEHGYPVVVKPRRGAASVGVAVLRDDDELLGWAAGTLVRDDDDATLLAESYVPGEMLHVDGMWQDGHIVASTTSGITSCLAFNDADSLLVSCMLDDSDPRTAAATRMAEQALHALPTPEATVFHMELFSRPDGELVFNEIASRIGGARVQDVLRIMRGRDPLQWFLEQTFCAQPPPLGEFRPGVAGWALVPPTPGVLREAPADCPVPLVVDYELRAAVGDELRAPVSSVDAIASFVAAGPDRSRVTAALRAAGEWFRATAVIE
jgi:biotin carboxylase